MKKLYNKVLQNPISLDKTIAGTGITTGVGTVYTSAISKSDTLIKTSIVLDLTGLNGGGANGDIIGKDATANSHIGQVLRGNTGTIWAGVMTCLELPAGGNVDIDLWSANEATGAEDVDITTLTGEVQLINAGNWTLGAIRTVVGLPVDGQYLYLTNGVFTAATYTAGQFLIELYGTP